MIKELLRYVLPAQIVDTFDLVNLQECASTLHLYLDECNIRGLLFFVTVYSYLIKLRIVSHIII